MTIQEWTNKAASFLEKSGIPTARLDAEVILAHTIKKPRTWLHAHNDESLDARTIDIAQARLDLRADRVPVAYIIGHKEFYGYQFKVTTATLIPRPESESLIELLKSSKPEPATKIVDVGTGSGALGIIAKVLFPETDVTLLDISKYALNIAEKNAKDLKADVNIEQSNLLDNYPYTADIIIANLPYVDANWERSPETDHEPANALFAEQGGLDLIFKLIKQSESKLKTGGTLILEADPEQHPKIKEVAIISGLILSSEDGYGLMFEKLK